ncbi:flagellar basal body rod protein FlgG [Pueribacillus theae]|uniref:Flagellar hook protein FlgE n=1 Tax=Pueribacillus theae TaxID=2171751 RepID=A0A2U1K8A8_9BACI|nr:flagellar basal body rod protein FlgG [Pueribacillus theae]PWA13509.1 flagellar basal body rod protein FlgG [Pueribacillus theae]
MLRSLYSGISGMKNFQTKMDVIGNNISNVNTYGFKKGRVTFSDLVSQQLAGANAPAPAGGTGGTGGTNPKQVGLGAQIASIDTIHTATALQTTGRPLDLGINGDGYFAVTDGENVYYTRAGNFYLDEEGYVVSPDGLYLTQNGTTGSRIRISRNTTESFSIGKDGTVSIKVRNNANLDTSQQIRLAVFSNPEGLEKIGGNLFRKTVNSGEQQVETPNQGGVGSVISNALEMSNVDLSEEFTEMIVAQRGFQANTRIITTSDEILQELVNLKR